jgi:hypothetical protein
MATYVRMLGAIAAVLLVGGCATTAGNMPPKAVNSAAAAKDLTCPTQTGSRIGVNGTNCLGFGRSYSADDIGSTGATSAGGALRLLDPSVTIVGAAAAVNH